jgi:oxygen-independent coproporphyrinogen-3 oxidase
LAGTLRRNFQGYTSDDCEVLLGIGCSAIGALPQGYVQNANDLRSWRRMIESGVPATSRDFHLNDIDRLRRHVIERLMCDLSVDLEGASHRYGFRSSVSEAEKQQLRQLEAEGLVTIEGRKIALTSEGWPLMRIVAAIFDTYLSNSPGRHAVAV